MPGMDGRGPTGMGPATGRGLGRCNTAEKTSIFSRVRSGKVQGRGRRNNVNGNRQGSGSLGNRGR